MTSDLIDKLFRRRRERTYWVRHAEVSALVAGGQASWTVLAARLAQKGVEGRDGQPPTADAVAKSGSASVET